MPYANPAARRACHRASDLKRRASVLAYRKRQRLEAKRAQHGGELDYLIAEQTRDARTHQIKYGPTFLDRSPVEWAA